MNHRDLDLVTTIFDLEPTSDYVARATAAANELLGSSGCRVVLRDGTEYRSGEHDGASSALSVPLTHDAEPLGTLHFTPMPSADETASKRAHALASLIARGLTYGKRLGGGGGRELARALADSPLTPRERDVVARLVSGASTRDISQAMGLTVSTVNTYMKRIFAKLGVHSRVELVAWVNGTRAQ